MNATSRTPEGWRDLVCNAGLDRTTTRAALNFADHSDGLPPKEGPHEKPPADIDAVINQSLTTLENLGFIQIHEPATPEKGGFRYRLVIPSGADVCDKPMNPTRAPDPAPKSDDIFSVTLAPSQRGPARKPPKRKGIRRRETVLYYYFDDQDVLLYVGITANLPNRQDSHETDSTWMDFAARSTIEHFADRDDALVAEKTAIEEHAPLFNVEHNDRPDRVRRIVDYLIARDRRDLLVPLISRG